MWFFSYLFQREQCSAVILPPPNKFNAIEKGCIICPVGAVLPPPQRLGWCYQHCKVRHTYPFPVIHPSVHLNHLGWFYCSDVQCWKFGEYVFGASYADQRIFIRSEERWQPHSADMWCVLNKDTKDYPPRWPLKRMQQFFLLHHEALRHMSTWECSMF